MLLEGSYRVLLAYSFCLPAAYDRPVCFECHSCLWYAFIPSPASFCWRRQVYGVVSFSTDSVSVMVPGGCRSQGYHGYLHVLLKEARKGF